MKKRINKAKVNIKDFFHNFFEVLKNPAMVILPGNLSYFFMLAIVPSLGLITYAASILNLSVDFLYEFLSTSFSKDIADLILGVNLGNYSGITFLIIVFIGFYMVSNGAESIITASNTIYGFENKSFFKRRIKAFGLSFLIVILLIFLLIVPVFGNIIIDLIKEVNLNGEITKQIVMVFDLLKGPFSWLFMFVIIRIIYTVAPNGKLKNRVINYGAVFTTVGWIIGTKLYSIYVTNYAEYSVLYGGFASIVVLLIWLYFLSYIFTVGIALNCQKDESNLLKNGTVKKKK